MNYKYISYKSHDNTLLFSCKQSQPCDCQLTRLDMTNWGQLQLIMSNTKLLSCKDPSKERDKNLSAAFALTLLNEGNRSKILL